MKLLILQLPPFAVTASLLGPDILLRTLFSNTQSLPFPYYVYETKFHTHPRRLSSLF
jgi:hypothetical protein